MAKRPWIVAAIESPEEHPVIFVFVITLALAVAGNGISNLVLDNLCTWLEQQTKIAKLIWQLGTVSSLALFFLINITNISAVAQRQFGRRIPYRAKVRPLTTVDTVKGLIVFMSLGVEPPAKTAILHHWQDGKGKLEHCWLICGGDPSLNKATELVDLLIKNGLPQRIFHFGDRYQYPNAEDPQHPFSLVTDPNLANDPSCIYQIVEAIYTSAENSPYSLAESEIIIDYTGGTKSMTAGAILAGASPKRRLQYIISDYRDNQPINSRVMEVDISYQVKPNK
jgi:CRISPR-associated protein (Cas_Cas02710)